MKQNGHTPAESCPIDWRSIPIVGAWLDQLFCGAQRSQQAIARVVACADNTAIRRSAKAGNIEEGAIELHNGLHLKLQGMDPQLKETLIANKGVAEPQHENAFAQLVRVQGNSPLILDVGAREGYYALWLKKERPGARCVLVGPDATHIKQAEANFQLNRRHAQFFRAYIGRHTRKHREGLEVYTIEDLAKKLKTDYIAILHADIEGYELELLQGAAPLLKDRGIDYIMLSTHTDGLHTQCQRLLEASRYTIIASLSPRHSCVPDGLLVARRSELKGPDRLELHPHTP